jgi:plasmid replication initiation protein
MKDKRDVGRDELNFAEFPLGVLTERVPPGVKTLTFEGHQGRLVVTGSDYLGLPTPLDTDVLIALLALTKAQNNFTNPTVTFSRFQLLEVLGMSKDGKGYRRLVESLRRWVGVSLHYDGVFWDNELKCRVSASFNVLSDVTVFDMKVRRKLVERQQPLPLSSFTWSKRFFESCQADNLKRLDLGVYYGLRSSVSKQIYRFLDKRFHIRKDWTFQLREFAFAHVGLSRNYADDKIRDKLKPALTELTEISFLKRYEFVSVKRGQWSIRLVGNGKPALALN